MSYESGQIAHAQNDQIPPKAMIVPHAGYLYSGPIAASAYATLFNRTAPIKRVILIGPDHRVGFRGIAAPSSDYFETLNTSEDQIDFSDLAVFSK